MKRLFFLLVSLSPCLLVSPALAQDKDQPWVVYDGFKGPGNGKHIVLVSGDEEYRSEEALPQLGKILAKHHGFKCTVLFAIDPKTGEINPNISNIPGLEALKTADLMILFTRFRNLPDEQMAPIVDYVEAGKPIIGIRTATHAFANLKGKYAKYNWTSNDKSYLKGFGRQILGETWVSHHGGHGTQSSRGILNKEQANHPILRGIKDGDIWGPTDVYGADPLPPSMVLVWGEVLSGMKATDKGVYFTKEEVAKATKAAAEFQVAVAKVEKEIVDDLKAMGKKVPDKKSSDYAKVIGSHPQGKEWNRLKGALGAENKILSEAKKNDPMMPLAWTREYKGGRVFTSTLGASQDLVADGSRRMFVNAAYWCMGMEKQIPAMSNVEIVGTFEPLPFRTGGFKKGVRPSQLGIK